MLITDYQLPDPNLQVMRIADEGFSLFADIPPATALLVWRRALDPTALLSRMQDTGWPRQLLFEFPPGDDWPWTIKDGSGNESGDPDRIYELLGDACGIMACAHGNVAITLSLRSYEERQSEAGGLAWWRRTSIARNNEKAFLVPSLIRLLEQAHSVGSELFVEQITVVISKDTASPSATLTPIVHADKYYGRLETATCSIIEPRYDSLGGTLFLPTTNMQALWTENPIDLTKLLTSLSHLPIVLTGSGDMAIFDGRRDDANNEDRMLGVPHISPDLPGKSSRIVLLMYHRRAR